MGLYPALRQIAIRAELGKWIDDSRLDAVIAWMDRLQHVDAVVFWTCTQDRTIARWLAVLGSDVDATEDELARSVADQTGNKWFRTWGSPAAYGYTVFYDELGFAEPSLNQLRQVGVLLRAGLGIGEVADHLKLNRNTVSEIDHFFGITALRRSDLVQAGIDHLLEGGSVREFAKDHNLSKSTAARILTDSRVCVRELGFEGGDA